MEYYDIYFEIFGKKMKTTISARSPAEAKEKIISKIKWHKINKTIKDNLNTDNEVFETLKDIFKMK